MAVSTNNLYALGPGLVVIAGHAPTNSDGEPTSIVGRGVVSAVETAAGHYTLTLDREYPAILAVIPSVEIDSLTTDLVASVKEYSASAKTVEINTRTGAVATSIASGALHWIVVARNTSVV